MVLGVKGQGHQKISCDGFLYLLLVNCDMLSILFNLISHLFFLPSQDWKICLLFWDQRCEMTEYRARVQKNNGQCFCEVVMCRSQLPFHLICGDKDRSSSFSLYYCFSFNVNFNGVFWHDFKAKTIKQDRQPRNNWRRICWAVVTAYAAQEIVLETSTASFWHAGDTVPNVAQVQKKGENSDAYGIPYIRSASVRVFIYTSTTMNFQCPWWWRTSWIWSWLSQHFPHFLQIYF